LPHAADHFPEWRERLAPWFITRRCALANPVRGLQLDSRVSTAARPGMFGANQGTRHERSFRSPGVLAKGWRRQQDGYSAKDIEVLEGLEPVRRRPGMYIGGTDENALHHLASEIIDNAMDEAVAGRADRIEVTLEADNWLAVRDNGRGIPVDPHPKFPKLSALEVILTTLHSGGKFSGKAYDASGGLHGVGVIGGEVNALSERMRRWRSRVTAPCFTQVYSRGKAITKLKDAGAVQNRRGTTIRFKPDPEIFAKR
jgi:topoisomerase-4 subunit B